MGIYCFLSWRFSGGDEESVFLALTDLHVRVCVHVYFQWLSNSVHSLKTHCTHKIILGTPNTHFKLRNQSSAFNRCGA